MLSPVHFCWKERAAKICPNSGGRSGAQRDLVASFSASNNTFPHSTSPLNYFSTFQNVFVQISNCICPNCKAYLTKLQMYFSVFRNVFFQMQNVFVKTDKYICQKNLAASFSASNNTFLISPLNISVNTYIFFMKYQNKRATWINILVKTRFPCFLRNSKHDCSVKAWPSNPFQKQSPLVTGPEKDKLHHVQMSQCVPCGRIFLLPFWSAFWSALTG